jgi:hypothetical protein
MKIVTLLIALLCAGTAYAVTETATAIIGANTSDAIIGANTSGHVLTPDPLLEMLGGSEVFAAEVDNTYSLTLIAGSDFSTKMQYAAGDHPYPFTPGVWPTAEVRTAKSPAGYVLATYTIVVEDEAQAIWSLKLSRTQTAALAGKTGLTELKIPDGDGVYFIWARIKTTVISPVTQ